MSSYEERSPNNANLHCIGVQFLYLRCSMTRIVVDNRTDSSLIVQNKNALKRDSERSEESIFVFFRGVCHSVIVR
ncbi:hypothetical protein [Sphingobacterium sp.]|uniref:hypothetical protein n=1 Tax=Sphingobacterium sp. TaxID=341027 RepID=UPI0028A82909|nr:hypothetical protein [Sphingobacterium sp.]